MKMTYVYVSSFYVDIVIREDIEKSLSIEQNEEKFLKRILYYSKEFNK